MSSSGSNLERYLIPLEEIKRATENFSQKRRIGGGKFGTVYEGQLSERWQNQIVAIKRLDQDCHQGECEILWDVERISIFNHKNIIPFIGYCDEEKEMITVYEYAINGSLDRHLQDPNKMRCMTWTQRLQICIGAARGLNYLHSGLGEHDRVIHRDVKSANILLDGNLEAKICDFGLSKVGPRNQPDTQFYKKFTGARFRFRESDIPRKESDIYSFGVVLFEMLSGTLVYRQRSIGNEKQFLINTVRRYHHYEPEKIIDPLLIDQISCRSYDAFKEIAYQCISWNSNERPAMETVVNKIEEALRIQTSVRSVCTLAGRSEIQSLVTKLYSDSPNDQEIAAREIYKFSKRSDESCVIFGQAGAIRMLTGLLTASDSKTQESAVIALHSLMFWEDNLRAIESCRAVSGIVHVLRTGTIQARESAVAILVERFRIEENKVTIDAAIEIPPLVLLLTEGSLQGQIDAATVLLKYQGNTRTAVSAGVVPVLMKLLTRPEHLLTEKALAVLALLSSHREGKLAIRKVAVSVLVELLGSGSLKKKENAAALLVKLSSVDRIYLVDAEKLGIMGSLMDLLQYGTRKGKDKAKQLLDMIDDNRPRPRQRWPACVSYFVQIGVLVLQIKNMQCCSLG